MKVEKRGGACGFLSESCAENALISKSNKGDKKAFELLMNTYLKVIYNYIRIHIKNNEDTQDIVQEVMLSVWSGLRTFEGNSSFKTWIISITHRKICDFYRSEYKTPVISICDAEEHLISQEDEPEKLIVSINVKNILMNLNNADQELVFLVFSAQLTYNEISEIIGIPCGTVKSRMSGIKKKLRKQLEKE